MKNPDNPFAPHRPNDAETESNIRLKSFEGVSAEILNWIENQNRHPGECIQLSPVDATVLDSGDPLTAPTLSGHRETGTERPEKSCSDLTKITVLTVNVNAFGGTRQDRDYRSKENLLKNEQVFLDFLQSEVGQRQTLICLQDVPIYRLRVLGRHFHENGFAYYANVVGINGDEPGHIASLVTLLNTRALEGYTVPSPEFFMTKHYQNMRRRRDGKGYESGNPQHEATDWDINYGPTHKNEALRHAFGTFHARITVQGTDGERVITVGNIYMSPPSLQVERAKNIRASLTHLKELSEPDGIAILAGDCNSYGVDTTHRKILGMPVHPPVTAAGAILRTDIHENKHLEKIAKQAGFTPSDVSHTPTLRAAGGLVGMKLDHIFVFVPSENLPSENLPPGNLTAGVVPVSFTDHDAVGVEVCL